MSRRRPAGSGSTKTPPRVRAAKSRPRASASAKTRARKEQKAPRARSTRADGPKSPLRRRRWWRITRVAAIVMLALATLGVGARWVLAQPILRVQHVSFVGLRHESAGSVLAASGLGTHPSMFSVTSAKIDARLSRFPWILSAEVQKHWPNRVVVVVHETSPVAVAFNQKHELQYVDARGRDLGTAPLAANLPTLTDTAKSPGAWPYEGSAQAGALVASQLPKAFAWQVDQVQVSASGSVSLKMTTPVTFILGPATDLHDKFVAIASVIAHSNLGPGDVVDVTVPDELAVTGPPPQ